jgi:hypothetical protein
MTEKVKFELAYLLKTSPKILENMISTPSGLSEWFANDVNIKEDVYTFFWDGSEEKARLLSGKAVGKTKFQWINDEEDGRDCYFEMSINIDPLTKSVVMHVTDFAYDDEIEEAQMLWEQQINDLKRVLGA